MNSYDDRLVPSSAWEFSPSPQAGTAPLMPRRQSRAIPPGPPPSSSLPPPPAQPQSHPFSVKYDQSNDEQPDELLAGPSRSSTVSRRSNGPSSSLLSAPDHSHTSSSGPSSSSRLSPNPPSPPKPTPRPSSRRALIAALQLAQEAVQLDSEGADPHAAVVAYSRSVALLSEVMDRVLIGENTDGASSQSSRTLTAREEEVRRLRSIHDTYAERMEVLCNIYNIPISEHRVSSNPLSHLTAHSPESSSAPIQTELHPPSRLSRPVDGVESIGSAMVSLESSPDDKSMTSATFDTPPASNRTSVVPPIRPPPLGPPPPKPMSALLVRPSNLIVPPTVVEPSPFSSDRTAVHRRVPSTGSEQGTILEEDEPTARLSMPTPSAFRQKDPEYVIPPTPTNFVHPPIDPRSPPTPTLSPTTPRAQEASFKRGASDSVSSQVTSFSTDSNSASSMAYVARPRGLTGSSVSSWSDSGGDASEKSYSKSASSLVSGSTAHGSIAQRRKSAFPPLIPPVPGTTAQTSGTLPSRLTADALPLSTATSLGMASGRHRAVSQPGRRPSLPGTYASPPEHAGLIVAAEGQSGPSVGGRPPMPPPPSVGVNNVTGIPRKTSIPSSMMRYGGPNANININVQTPAATQTAAVNGYFQVQQATMQGPPPSPPVDPLRRPFHLMSLLLTSVSSKQGGFLTRRLYVPHDVWSQGGAKLSNLSEKGKCVEILNGALEEVVLGSGEFFRGAGRNNAEKWLKCLDEWTSVCDSTLSSIGKKLGVGESITGRKNSGVTSWGGKFTRTFDRMTSGKNFDSPTVYNIGLARLFQQAQLFDEHIKAFSNSFNPTPYSALPPDLRHQIEGRLKRSSEFFASVVLTWVIRDLGLLLDKYVKKGEKWLAE